MLGYNIDATRTLGANLDDFTKVTIELSNTGEVVSNENEVVILLNSLPETFDAISATIEYNRKDLTLGVVVYVLRSKELEMKLSNKNMFNNNNNGGDALTVKGRKKKRL